MRHALFVLGALVGLPGACSRAPRESAAAERADASLPVVSVDSASAPHETTPALTTTVTVRGPVDRAKAERIGLFYARLHWARYKPQLATAFNTGHGDYKVVVGFDGRPDAASVWVRIDDGEVVDASIAPRDD
jgi:hypothetical protein